MNQGPDRRAFSRREFNRLSAGTLVAPLVTSAAAGSEALQGSESQRQKTGGPAEAHRRLLNHPPSIGSDFDRTPCGVGEVEIDVAVVLSDADVDGQLGTIELRLRFKQIDRGVKSWCTWDISCRFIISAP